jgi:hypothetical protein
LLLFEVEGFQEGGWGGYVGDCFGPASHPDPNRPGNNMKTGSEICRADDETGETMGATKG